MSIRELTSEEKTSEIWLLKMFRCSWCREAGEEEWRDYEEIAGVDDELGGPVCRDCVESSEPINTNCNT